MFTGFSRGRWVAIGEVFLVAVLVAAAMAALLRSGADMEAFAGRFHPLVVHLPIGFLLLTAVVEGLSRVSRFTAAAVLVPVLLAITAASTVAAIVTGTLLAGSGDYDAALVARHQAWGWYLGVGVALACAAAWWRATQPGAMQRRLLVATLATSLVLVSVTGHFGGALTHGETYLTEHMPRLPFFTPATASTTRGPVDLGTTQVFATLVAPTLDARCVQCHGPARQAGKLRLDSPEGIAKGGESGPALVPGNAAGSELVRRIFLPTSDKKVMPPRGHAPPSHAEVLLLRWWIDQGAAFDQVLADAEVTADLEPAIADRLGPVDFSAPAILSVRVPPADQRAIDALKALQLRVEPLRADTGLLLVQAPPAARGFSDEDLGTIAPLAQHVAWLDLGGTAVTDDGLTAVLPTLPNLWKLSLDRTAITDRTLAALGGLERLETLNVYSTGITDEGLSSLARLPRLRAVYAWQTAVTPAGADALDAANGKLQVNLGAPAAQSSQPEAQGTREPSTKGR